MRLSNIKWNLVEKSLSSPALGRLANNLGQSMYILSGHHYLPGLSRAALKASIAAQERGIRDFKIENSCLMAQTQHSGWITLYSEPKFFSAAIQHSFTVDDNNISPTDFCKLMRWQVFYDQKKVKLFAKAAFVATSINLALTSVLSIIFNAKAKETGSGHLTDYYMGLIEAKNTVIAWYPDFHDANDPARINLTNGPIPSYIAMHILLASILFSSLAHFQKTPINKFWDNLSNLALGICVSFPINVIFSELIFNGAWDYFLVFNKYVLPIGPMNVTDITFVSILPLVLRGLIGKLPARHNTK